MRLCKKIIAVAIATQLAACGGGDDSDSAVGTTASISGKAADGYLTDAKACLDSNLNKLCDVNEPSAMTGSAGEFTIQAEQSVIDTAPILIEAIAGKTVDLDDPNNTISDNYTLSAPAKSLFVSPISTLVQNEIELGSSQQEAIESISQKLGSTIDIAADYVKLSAEDSADSPEYERLHKTAQVLVDIQVKKAKELQTVSGVAHSDKMAVINSELEKQLDQIANKVDAAGDSFDSDTVANEVLPGLDITEENLQDKVDAIESEKNSVSSDMLALLKSLSIGSVMSDGPLLYHELLELKQEKTDGSMHDLLFTTMQYDESYETLRPVNELPTDFLLTDAGWVLADDKVIGLQQINGVDVLVTALPELSMQVSIKKMDVSDNAVVDFLGDGAETWERILDKSATFAPATYAYQLKTKPVEQLYRLNSGPWCSEEGLESQGGICNVVSVGNGTELDKAISLSSVTKPAADMQHQGTILLGERKQKHILAEMLADGTVNFYVTGETYVDLIAIEGKGTWSDKVVFNQTIRTMTAPPSVYRNLDWGNFSSDNKVYLGEVRGYLRVLIPSSNLASESIWFDQNVFSQLEQAISQPLTMGQCLASLKDRGYTKQVGDFIKYTNNIDYTSGNTEEYMEKITYQGSKQWDPDYKTIADMPAWVNSDVAWDQFERFNNQGEKIYNEENYYSHLGFHGWNNSEAKMSQMVTPLSPPLSYDSMLLTWFYQHDQERVRYSDLDAALQDGASYMALPKNYLMLDEVYWGKENVKVPAGEFEACVTTEANVYGYSEYWHTNRGVVKRESVEYGFINSSVREATEFSSQ